MRVIPQRGHLRARVLVWMIPIMVTAKRNSVVPRRLNIGFVVEKKVSLMVDDQLSDVNRYSVVEGIGGWFALTPVIVQPFLHVLAICR